MDSLKLEYDEQKIRNAELQSEINIVKSNIHSLINDVNNNAEKIEKRHLEGKWGPNGTEEDGLDAKTETVTLVKQLVDNPDMLESVLTSLKHRQAKMNAEITETKSKLQQLLDDECI